MAVINYDIPDHLKEAVEAEAKRRGLAQRTIMVLVLEAYFGIPGQPSGAGAMEDGQPAIVASISGSSGQTSPVTGHPLPLGALPPVAVGGTR